MSVLDFVDLGACANKVRKPGYFRLGTKFIDGIPVQKKEWVKDGSSLDCKYDRKFIDPACAAENCPRLVK